MTTHPDEAEPTLANWRLAPYSSRSFHNVEALVPVVRAAAGTPRPFETAPTPVDGIAFEGPDGQERRVGEAMAATATRGLVVLKRGRLVAERYGHGYDGDTPHIIFSITKSVTALLAGIVVEQGKLDPEQPVTRYVPEVAGSAYGDCTVRHVLDMTVSSSFVEDYNDPDSDYVRYRRATLWNPLPPGEKPESLHEFLADMRPAPEPHGEIFRYLSPNADLLGWIVERAAGERIVDLLSDHLLRPMRAEAPGVITVDRDGSPRTGGGLSLRLRDLARLGELMRNHGEVEGRQVLPRDWVTDIREAGDSRPWRKGSMAYLFPEGRYRSQWYQTGNASGSFCGIGIHGQWLWIDPAREVVIAKAAAQPEPVDDPTDALMLRAFEAIAAAV
ncbi:serine hydrolase domain-containing protein [Oceanibacterium hippocampi]|uniref:6-aminohexanoate-dimer hydrolase n=1 Tax=Oceanibacterium hippocampi TaxID=745714 RepID=A0A1Y5THU2_9PROT|nr:serine hydrolase [Oceanibacterium hippocampi]SLN62380.1 6-aminohexanoate-dimer hydrolase [Oceanibacterium hippocampi]